MLRANSLVKRFTRARLALDHVSFSVEEGEIMGLLGHNGAGKSTAVGIMLGMVRPDAGEVHLGGISVQRDRSKALRQVGAIFEAPSFYEYMSGWQNLRALCALSGWWEEQHVQHVLQLVRLKDRIQHKVSTYSHGMRQRLALAQALLPMPRILLLDEPTDGLDPEGIHEFRSTILELRKQHHLTILMNSHLLSEVEMMCDRCVVLQQGRKIYEGILPSSQEQGAAQFELHMESAQLNLAKQTLAHLHPNIQLEEKTNQTNSSSETSRYHLTLPETLTSSQTLATLVQANIAVQAWIPLHQTLEDWYLQLSENTPSTLTNSPTISTNP